MAAETNLGIRFVARDDGSVVVEKFAKSLKTVGITAKTMEADVKVGVTSLKSLAGALQGALGVIGVSLAGGAIVNFGRRMLDNADAVAKASQRVGVAAEAYQELGYAAKLSGLEQAELERALAGFGRRLGEAKAGTGEAREVLARYGITAGNVEAALGQAADAIAGAQSETERLRIAAKLFGDEAGAKLVPLLSKGSAGLAAMRQEARDLGVVLGDQAVKDAEAAKDEFEKLALVVETGLTKAFLDMAPALKDAAEGFRQFLTENDWEAWARTVVGALGFVGRGVRDLLSIPGDQALFQEAIERGVLTRWEWVTGNAEELRAKIRERVGETGERQLRGAEYVDWWRMAPPAPPPGSTRASFVNRATWGPGYSDFTKVTEGGLGELRFPELAEVRPSAYSDALGRAVQNRGANFASATPGQSRVLGGLSEDLEEAVLGLGVFREALPTDEVSAYDDALAAAVESLGKFREAQPGEAKTAQAITWYDGARKGVKEYAVAAADAFGQAQDAALSFFSGFEDAVVRSVTQGKLAFSDFAQSVIADLTRIFVRQQIVGPLASGLLGFFGPGSGGTGPAMAMGGAVAHGGGVLGADALPWRGAPRFHRGIGPDEVPAILQRGEGVFTPGQMRAMAPAQPVTVNVVNNTGAAVETREGRGRLGERVVEIVVGAVAADVARGGAVGQAVAASFGLRRAGRRS